ncbi:hypothetical protein BDP81DRAFT_429150 [Colletotrichum phormii]|uniref:Uncharacterized protein n=1 Tax=Colletotrichum phormii TaxID=359342 RepID=A0AAJ0EGK8_9PEZI|nr:uncharacterized protein BDP81DRAFT_429150 [Colletotrichum phormii]KAK1636161.1 hypothetical protein BDP81DRAFT_429150 [Colletotrichum phormii]
MSLSLSSASSMPPNKRKTFFHLPRELRDMIYRFYVVSDGGYVLNPESNRLRDAMGRPIDLALSYSANVLPTK